MNVSYGYYAEAYDLLVDKGGEEIDDGLWRRVCSSQLRLVPAKRHWEFVAIGLLHRIDTGQILPDRFKTYLRESQIRFESHVYAKNFALMRAVVEARLNDRLLTYDVMRQINLRQDERGCLVDGPAGQSSQYHAYMLLLLLRFGDRSDPRLRGVISSAVNWLVAVFERYGDPSPIGRGRFQTFGYAVIRRVFALASSWGVTMPEGYGAIVQARLDAETPDGALSSSWTGPHRDALLHGYNTPADYRAFANFWRPSSTITQAPKFSKDMCWLHALDFHGSVILADDAGVIAAVMPAPLTSPVYLGRKKVVKDFIQQCLRNKRYAEDVMPLLCNGAIPGFEPAKLSLARAHGKMTLSLTLDTAQMGAWHSPITWTPENANVDVSCDGWMETRVWKWGGKGSSPWVGHSFRIFDKGRVTWVW
jgi:hypothetical protein